MSVLYDICHASGSLCLDLINSRPAPQPDMHGRARARSLLLAALVIIIIILSRLRELKKCLFEGLNMHENSGKLERSSGPVKNLIFYGRWK